ncbi:MAG: GAK system CofD-like protein [Desulfovibrionaceae bacterium]|nr:GAK system CofD-like protein [Desulfovibrionaceae bacterium]
MKQRQGTAEARIAFFTGGTAVRAVSQALVPYTSHAAHLITTFDSGGSTAALRHAFAMLAVGDLRNRLLALADRNIVPPCVLEACALRLPAQGDAAALRALLQSYAQAESPLWQGMPPAFATPLRTWLEAFVDAMPSNFEPHVAILGNLILAGGYLRNGRRIMPVLRALSEVLHVRGQVLPIVYESLHLAAELADGTVLVGQHKFCHLGQPVRRLFLTTCQPDSPEPVREAHPPLAPAAAATLAAADAICYPMGSFYTSVVANLLPQGVTRAIEHNPCPKFYIANTGFDAEQCGHSVAERVRVIVETLRRQWPDLPAARLLHTVLIDTAHGEYPCGIDAEGIAAQGVALCDMPLVDPAAPQRHDPELTARAIMQQAGMLTT